MNNLLIIAMLLLGSVVNAQEVGSKKNFRKVFKGAHAFTTTDDGEGIEFYNSDRCVWKIDWKKAQLTYSQHGEFASEPKAYTMSEAFENDDFFEVTVDGDFEIYIELTDGSVKRATHQGTFTILFDKHDPIIVYRFPDGRQMTVVNDSYYEENVNK